MALQTCIGDTNLESLQIAAFYQQRRLAFREMHPDSPPRIAWHVPGSTETLVFDKKRLQQLCQARRQQNALPDDRLFFGSGANTWDVAAAKRYPVNQLHIARNGRDRLAQKVQARVVGLYLDWDPP
jgi:hypothetical protein